jgi:hypothetical protein
MYRAALSVASSEGYVDTVRILLEHGADLKVQSEQVSYKHEKASEKIFEMDLMGLRVKLRSKLCAFHWSRNKQLSSCCRNMGPDRIVEVRPLFTV